MANAPGAAPLLAIRDLVTCFDTAAGPARVVDGVSLHVNPGEILGLVGESGSGKSMTAFSILGLVPAPGRVVSGDIQLEGRSVLRLDEAGFRELRGQKIALVWQEGQNALNPVLHCGEQVAEVLRENRSLGRRDAWRGAVDLLRRVHLPDPERAARQYAHELSGGMAQRVVLAMALAARPKLLIADEATAGLDLTVQAQVLSLLAELQAAEGLAILLITHDLGVVAQVAHRVAVMYAGRIVETGPAADVFREPRHPYTRGLLRARPMLLGARQALQAIPGTLPDPHCWPASCRFQPRCDARVAICEKQDPGPRRVGADREVRCFVDLPGGEPSPAGPSEGDGGGSPGGLPESRLDS
jgi:peptide/nickel transport system ATP-binding protein